MPTIVVDAGHGGARAVKSSTPIGVVGPNGVQEKDVNLDAALRLAARLGTRATLTRGRDQNLSLSDRIAVATRLGAGSFVSIHANEGDRGARGSELWIHEQSGPASLQLANRLAHQLRRLGGPVAVRRGPLAVLSPEHHRRGTAACLLELDNLSHPQGERRLRDPVAMNAIADALTQGLGRASATYGDGGGALDWPSRLAKAIPDDYARDFSHLEILHYVCEVVEAIDALLEIGSTWEAVAEGASVVEEGVLEGAIEGVTVVLEGALTVLAPLAGLVGEFVVLGLPYAKVREETAETWGKEGFARGVVWTASDRSPTDIRRPVMWDLRGGSVQSNLHNFWVPAGLPTPNAFTTGDITRVALRSYQMGLLAGMASGRQLTTTQKSNFFQELRSRDREAHVDWSNLDRSIASGEWYLNVAALFRAHHLDAGD